MVGAISALQAENGKGSGPAPAAAPDTEVETVQRETRQLNSEEQLAAIERDAPELLALLGELQVTLREVRSRVGPLLKEVRLLAAPAWTLHARNDMCCCLCGLQMMKPGCARLSCSLPSK